MQKPLQQTDDQEALLPHGIFCTLQVVLTVGAYKNVQRLQLLIGSPQNLQGNKSGTKVVTQTTDPKTPLSHFVSRHGLWILLNGTMSHEKHRLSYVHHLCVIPAPQQCKA